MLERDGIQVELEELKEFEVYEDVPESAAYDDINSGKATLVATRWENKLRKKPGTDEFECRARFVALESEQQDLWRDDDHALATGPWTSRVMDFMASKGQLSVFTCDVINAYFHMPEEELCYAHPPWQYLDSLAEGGSDPRVLWRLRRQLQGRRCARRLWMRFLAAVLCDLGFMQCTEAPQFYYDEKRGVGLEAHVDGLHGLAALRLA